MHPFSSGLCLLVRNAAPPWLWRYGLVSFAPDSSARTQNGIDVTAHVWQRDVTLWVSPAHRSSAAPRGYSWPEQFMRWTRMSQQSEPLFLQGSQHWLALGDLQYRSLDQNLWLDLVQRLSPGTQCHVRGCFYQAKGQTFSFKTKAVKKNRMFHSNSQVQSPRNVFFSLYFWIYYHLKWKIGTFGGSGRWDLSKETPALISER